MTARRAVRTVTGMADQLQVLRVVISFVGAPPVRQVERASGVSNVAVAGSTLRCVVCGSFQPFLEALRGHEVISLESTPIAYPGGPPGPEPGA